MSDVGEEVWVSRQPTVCLLPPPSRTLWASVSPIPYTHHPACVLPATCLQGNYESSFDFCLLGQRLTNAVVDHVGWDWSVYASDDPFSGHTRPHMITPNHTQSHMLTPGHT